MAARARAVPTRRVPTALRASRSVAWMPPRDSASARRAAGSPPTGRLSPSAPRSGGSLEPGGSAASAISTEDTDPWLGPRLGGSCGLGGSSVWAVGRRWMGLSRSVTGSGSGPSSLPPVPPPADGLRWMILRRSSPSGGGPSSLPSARGDVPRWTTFRRSGPPSLLMTRRRSDAGSSGESVVLPPETGMGRARALMAGGLEGPGLGRSPRRDIDRTGVSAVVGLRRPSVEGVSVAAGVAAKPFGRRRGQDPAARVRGGTLRRAA